MEFQEIMVRDEPLGLKLEEIAFYVLTTVL
jgi:hypothetical protein